MTKNTVQSILIPIKQYSFDQAYNWIIDHGYKILKIDVNEHFYRFRQFDTSNDKKYRTKKLPHSNIELILEYKK